MKTSLVKYKAPNESVFYNPPLKGSFYTDKINILAYVKGARFPIVTDTDGYGAEAPILVEVTNEPQRMVWGELIMLLNRGWVWRDAGGRVRSCVSVDESNLDTAVNDKVKVLRLDTAGAHWIEPTTDLLEGK